MLNTEVFMCRKAKKFCKARHGRGLHTRIAGQRALRHERDLLWMLEDMTSCLLQLLGHVAEPFDDVRVEGTLLQHLPHNDYDEPSGPCLEVKQGMESCVAPLRVE